MKPTRNLVMCVTVLLVFTGTAIAAGWSRTYDLYSSDKAECIGRCKDGGFVVAGSAQGNTWVLKLDPTGEVQWGKYYECGEVYAILETESGFIVTGDSWHGNEIFILHLDSQGWVRWVRYIESAGQIIGQCGARSVLQCKVGGEFVVAGYVDTLSGDRYEDAWVIKLNRTGDILWSRTFGTMFYERARSIDETTDGGLIVAGEQMGDAWVAKLDSSGNAEWQKTYSPELMNVEAYSVQQTSDEGYAVAGIAQPLSNDKTYAYVLKLDDAGVLEWHKTYGSTDANLNTAATSIRQALGGFVVVGRTDYIFSDLPQLLVMRLDYAGAIEWDKGLRPGIGTKSWGTSIESMPDGGFVVAGVSEDASLDLDFWVLKLDALGEIDESCPANVTNLSTAEPNADIISIQDAGTAFSVQTWDHGPLTWYDRPGTSILQCGCPEDPFEDDDHCMASETTILSGNTHTQRHNFCDDDEDWLKLNACAGRGYTITTSDLGSEADTVLEIYGPDCSTLIASDDNGGGGLASRIDWTAPADAVYHIRVSQADHTIGPDRTYDLNFTGDTSACAHWMRTYEGSWAGYPSSNPTSIKQTADGGLVVADRIVPPGEWGDYLAVQKLDATGKVEWHKTYRSEEVTLGAVTAGGDYNIQQTSDGGYVVAGDVFYMYQQDDFDRNVWVLKLDSAGVIQWQKMYGHAPWDKYEAATSIDQTTDGGYVVAGAVGQDPNSGVDIWVLKLDVSGNVQWQMKYDGGTDRDCAKAIRQTRDGGYFVVGTTYELATGSTDAWVLKLDAEGGVQWQKIVGPGIIDSLYSMELASDGGSLVLGMVAGDISVTKMDFLGNIQWDRRVYSTVTPPSEYLSASAISRSGSYGFVVAGAVRHYDPVWQINLFRSLVMRFDDLGYLILAKTYGGSSDFSEVQIAKASAPTSDGNFVVLAERWIPDAPTILRPDYWGEIGTCNLVGDAAVGNMWWHSLPDCTQTSADGVPSNAVAMDTNAVSVERDTTVTQQCPQTLCERDSDYDGDVDGSDLADLAADPGLLDIAVFAAEFGRTDCLE